MGNDRQAIEEVFRAARADFKLELIAWLAELHQLIKSLSPISETPEISDGVEHIRELAHKIAGSSGSFGLPGVSHAALPLEKYCMAIIESNNGLSDSEIRQIVKLENAVQTALDDAKNSPA
jgi:chemotaxis protein histidine kinase CheA